MLEGTTRLVVTTTKVKKKEYERFLIHIPSKVARDSQFPFASGDVLKIEVNPRRQTIVLSKPTPTRATRTRKRS